MTALTAREYLDKSSKYFSFICKTKHVPILNETLSWSRGFPSDILIRLYLNKNESA